MTGVGFFLGIAFATFGAAGVFFLKFWRASRDRFYLLFCAACWMLAVESVVLYFVREAQYAVRTAVTDATSWVFLLRLAAFALMLIAIIDKNRRHGAG